MADKKATAEPTLAEQLAQKQQDLLEAKRMHAAGELPNPRVLTKTRKEIARLKTALRADELAAEKESK